VAAAERPLAGVAAGRIAWGTALADSRGATGEALLLVPGSVSWPGGISHMVAATVSISVAINAKRPNPIPSDSQFTANSLVTQPVMGDHSMTDGCQSRSVGSIHGPVTI
jgi:hypothetical protein